MRGRADEVMRVRSSPTGPLVDELLGTDRPLSVRWSGQRVGGIDAFVALARASGGQRVKSALAAHGEPMLAVAWADSAGDGGVRVAGAAPMREIRAGFQPVPSGNPSYAWLSWIPADELPGRMLSASRPWVIAADLSPPSGHAHLEPMIRRSGRGSRIVELLQHAADDGPLDLTDLVAIQHDAYASDARPIVDRALALVGPLSHEEGQVAALLRDWDRTADIRSRGAAAHHVFVRRLAWALLEPAVGGELTERLLALPRVRAEIWIADVLAWAEQGGAEGLPWTAPAAVAEAVRSSLQQTWLTLAVELGSNREKWTWGRLHPVSFTPLWPGGWSDAAGLGPFPYGGDGSSLAVAEFPLVGPSEVDLVASYRFAADAGNLDQALTQLAPGQSEHPDHPHAEDGLRPWLRGQPSLLSTSDPVIEDGPVARLRLVPVAPRSRVMLAYAYVPGFYAEIERRRSPDLAERPVIVGGDPRKRGTVQAATADAVAAGVREGMSMVEALGHCPRARALRTDMKHYRAVDGNLRARFRAETDRVEGAGLGAGYLDLAGHDDPPARVAAALQGAVEEDLGLPLRMGIAPLKFVSRLAAQAADNSGIMVVETGQLRAFLDPLPVARLPGVGPRTAATFLEMDVRTVADLVAIGRPQVEERLGNHGLAAYDFASGRDPGRVRAAPHSRSLSLESTLASGELDRGVLEERLNELATGLEAALAREKLGARRVVLKVRYWDEPQPMTRSCTVNRPLTRAEGIREQVLDLLDRTHAGSREIRGVGISLQSLVRARRDDRQLELFGG